MRKVESVRSALPEPWAILFSEVFITMCMIALPCISRSVEDRVNSPLRGVFSGSMGSPKSVSKSVLDTFPYRVVYHAAVEDAMGLLGVPRRITFFCKLISRLDAPMEI